jgi:hypothetical protein
MFLSLVLLGAGYLASGWVWMLLAGVVHHRVFDGVQAISYASALHITNVLFLAVALSLALKALAEAVWE